MIAAVGRNDQSIEIDDIYAERVAHCVWDDLLREADEVNRLHTDIAESVDFVCATWSEASRSAFGPSLVSRGPRKPGRQGPGLVAQPVVDAYQVERR